MTTNVEHDAATAAPEADIAVGTDDSGELAAEAAKDTLAKARYEAFRLMTEARAEAESILDEARTEAEKLRTNAEMQAESIVDAAHMRAKEIQASEPSPETAESVAQLEHEHEELTQRVSSLRTLADRLEERFAALAASAHAPRPEINEPPRPVLDYSPSVPRPAKEEPAPPEVAAEPVTAAPTERGSFYSRRSAKLPRIGEQGGHNALDMMRSIRESFDE